MRVTYVPVGDRAWAQHFSRQSGAGFIGIPYQRGSGLGSIFRSIFRAILPIAKSAGRVVGKQALRTGSELASDLIAGKNLKASVKTRGKQAVASLLKKAANKLEQKGGRLGRKRKRVAIKGPASKRKRTIRRKRKRVADQLGVYYS